MNKKEVFKNELKYIKNENYKKNAEILLDLVPDYFFEVPAASTGKYHPDFAQGEGGLVRHTKAAMKIAEELLVLDTYSKNYTNDEKDLMQIAILLHDSHKLGKTKEKYTKFDHPIIAAEFIEENKDKTTFTQKEIDFLKETISSHMGQWNTSNYSDVVLPKPVNKYQNFVHQCDYISSKKYINFKFDQNDNII